MTHETFTRDSIPAQTAGVLKQAKSWFVPDVVLLEAGGAKYVLKDYSGRPWPVRATLGRSVIRREVRAYRLLAGLPCVPRLVAQVDPYGFVMEYLDAEPLPRRRLAKTLPEGFFDALHDGFARMHALGMAHGDVRRRNILAGKDGRPYLIDFQSAIFNGRLPHRRWFFNFMQRVDTLTLLKIQQKYFPRQMTAEQQRLLADVPMLLRVGRFLRQNIYQLLTPKGWKALSAHRRRLRKAARLRNRR